MLFIPIRIRTSAPKIRPHGGIGRRIGLRTRRPDGQYLFESSWGYQSVVQLVEPLIWDQEVGCSIHPTLTSIYNLGED